MQTEPDQISDVHFVMWLWYVLQSNKKVFYIICFLHRFVYLKSNCDLMCSLNLTAFLNHPSIIEILQVVFIFVYESGCLFFFSHVSLMTSDGLNQWFTQRDSASVAQCDDWWLDQPIKNQLGEQTTWCSHSLLLR